jgi:hypothetical protein
MALVRRRPVLVRASFWATCGAACLLKNAVDMISVASGTSAKA